MTSDLRLLLPTNGLNLKGAFGDVTADRRLVEEAGL